MQLSWLALKLGWAKALREIDWSTLCRTEFPSGMCQRFVLLVLHSKTFGGRASGPEPLVQLFDFVVRGVSKKAAGRRLTTTGCHWHRSLKLPKIVVVGGVRRSALHFSL
jgi:ribonucleoside-diphosphate reductase alpha chain